MLTENKISKHFILLVIIGIAANATGLFNEIVEPDGALYASLAKHIADNNDWINLIGDGREWLDKPHFPFWITAVSYKIFGVNAFAYKIPSFLCFLLGCFYTYKLALKIFNKNVAELATIIYITSLHVIICNYDVRAEGYLTCFVTASIYHLVNAFNNTWLKQIVLAAIYAALAIMTKGIFVYITIGSGFVVYWLLTKQYKEFINIKWYVFVLLSLIFIFPELYSLYTQFDIHPEKIVFETTNVSGLKFFFWDSQFGRFFNTGPIKGDGDILFFVHTILWAFLPWAFYILMALTQQVKKIKQFTVTTATIIYASALCSFLLFSVSKFQLPHYIVIIFPQLAMLVANYLLEVQFGKNLVIIKHIQTAIFIAIGVVIVAITYAYKLQNSVIPIGLLIVGLVVFFFVFKQNNLYHIILKGICSSVILALFLNFIFLPQVMYYESGMTAGKWQQKNLPNTIMPMFRCNDNMLEIYGKTNIKREISLSEMLKNNNSGTIYCYKRDFDVINKDSFSTKALQYFPYYPITLLSKDFINYNTRSKTLDSFVIATVTKKY